MKEDGTDSPMKEGGRLTNMDSPMKEGGRLTNMDSPMKEGRTLTNRLTHEGKWKAN